jgi:rod shape-determining protein MreC
LDERRTGYLLAFLLIGQFVLVAIQGARNTTTRTYAEAFGLRVLGPAARLVAGTTSQVSAIGRKVRLQGQLIEENRELRREVEQMQLRLLRLADVEQELSRLGEAVGYSAPLLGQIRAADVIYADHVSLLRSLMVYTGPQPAAGNQPVLSPAGLVGRVVLVAGRYAKVQLITDRAASVGGMIVRTRRQGVVRGSGQGEGGLTFEYVPLSADVRVGDAVVTAGIDGVYPRGIPVGTVVSIEAGGQLFHKILLAPAVDFGKLDQVYLLERPAPPADLMKAVPGAGR